MNDIWTQIQTVAHSSNGFIKTKEIEAIGIRRTRIKKYVESGQIERVRKGLYVLKDDMIDEYAVLQA